MQVSRAALRLQRSRYAARTSRVACMAAAASSKPPLTLKDGSRVKVLSFDVTGTLIVHRQATSVSAFALLRQGH